MSRRNPLFVLIPALMGVVLAAPLLGGCTVISVAGAAAGVAATGVGLAVDATVGAVKLTGQAVGAVLPGGGE